MSRGTLVIQGLSLALILGLGGSSLKAESFTLWYGDNFDVTAATTDLDPGTNDAADRFSGRLGALTYTVTSGYSVNSTQLGHSQFPESLLLAAKSSSHKYPTASPDYNFIDGAGSGEAIGYLIEYHVDPANVPLSGNSISTADWCAIIVGNSSQTARVNSSDGVGMLIRNNGGFQIFDGTNGTNTTVASGDLYDEYGIDESGFYDVQIEFASLFDDATQSDVTISVGGITIASFTTAGGFANNYIVFEGLSSQNTNHSAIDNLQVWSTAAVPEPSTISLCLMGSLSLLGYRCYRRLRRS